MTPRAVIFGDGASAAAIARTARSLARCGVEVVEDAGASAAWFVRAGAWPESESVQAPPESSTGLPLLAVGAARGADGHRDDDLAHLSDAIARSGGDLRPIALARALPPLVSVFADDAAAALVTARRARGASIEGALVGVAESGAARVVHVAEIDVRVDPRLRVLVVVTSLQQGGAERVALDLVEALPAASVFAGLVTTGRPLRATFPWPRVALDLSHAAPTAALRAAKAGELAAARGFDVVHAHLLDADATRAIGAGGVPVVVTAHNTREAWPRGFAELDARDVRLVIACSRAVERDLREVGPRAPLRTAWNGIAAPPPTTAADRARVRAALGVDEDDLVLVTVANPRPQKRLDRMPAALAAAQRELDRLGGSGGSGACGKGRRARLVICGELEPRTREGEAAARDLAEAIHAADVARAVVRTGSRDDVAALVAACDVYVSTSAHEGLSVAQLEALAAGLPVVASEVGGAPEIAARTPRHLVTLLPEAAAPERVAEAVVAASSARGALPSTFTRSVMAARHAALYRRAIAPRATGAGLWLVTNNLATGGAQTSARRLVVELARRGVRVRVVVLEEQAAFPTPGRRALLTAGVSVVAIDGRDARAAAEAIAARVDADPPRAVAFWNALAPVKVRVADLLLDVPAVDVSPGEMLFASLDRLFARPPDDLPYDARAYGERLAGVVVKYAGEAARAAELGARVSVVRNGVDVPPPREGARRDGPLRIGTTARLSPQKKLEELFAAIRLAAPRLPPWELLVAGAPERGAEEYAASLRASVSDLGVRFVGEPKDMLAFLGDLDLFVAISEPAGCPNATLEALASALPVVATDVGGASEQVVDGVSGRLVPRADPRALADAIVELARDGSTRARLAAAGRDHVAAEFSVEGMIEGYLRVFSLDGVRG